jgi:hypothetical protein
MWKKGITIPGREIEDFISFVDLAPTVFEAARLPWKETGMAPGAGRSLMEIFHSDRSGQVIPERDHVLIGRERTDVGRPHDGGYPIRGIVTREAVLLENFEASRWPGGNPETGYMDCDAGATKTDLIDRHRRNLADPFWSFCFGKRPALEFYDLQKDPDFVVNRPEDPRALALREKMHRELREQEDPRMSGKGDVFDKYPHAAKGNVGFYERFMRGEPVKASWIKPSDIEPRVDP